MKGLSSIFLVSLERIEEQDSKQGLVLQVTDTSAAGGDESGGSGIGGCKG